MATFNYLFITLFVAMFIPAATISSYSCSENIIPLDDIHAAVKASFKTYEKVGIGDRVDNYTVTQVYRATYRSGTILVLILDWEENKTTMIAFQGTKANVQLLQYAKDYIKSISNDKKIMTLRGKEVQVDEDGKQVSEGGYKVEVLDYFMSGMHTLLKKIKSHLGNGKRKYIFTGHSLGGAMASVLALQRQLNSGYEWMHRGSCLITFGQPRVGNGAYAALHDAIISPHRKLRFIYNHDMIPHLPPRPFPTFRKGVAPPLNSPGFLHHSREIYIRMIKRKRWWHFWVWVSNYWKFCDFRDPKYHPSKCSNDDLLNYSAINDHMAYKDIIKKTPGEYIWYQNGNKGTRSWEKVWQEACVNTVS